MVELNTIQTEGQLSTVLSTAAPDCVSDFCTPFFNSHKSSAKVLDYIYT